MKRTQLKDLLRNIARNKVSFISIIVIAVLGVSIFLGLNYSSVILTRNGSDYFNTQNFRDIELVSTLLFSQEDLEEIRGTEGVADVEPVWQVGVKASTGGDSVDANAVSLTERLNQPLLLEGRLPETETECAVERNLAEELGLEVGSEIRVNDDNGETVQYLRGNRFTVTGIANHADNSNTMVADTYDVLLTVDAFDMEALDGCFMKAEVAIEKPENPDRYGEEYNAALTAVQERLEALAPTAAARRDADVHEQALALIDEKQQELEQAKSDLADARIELDEGWKELADGERELAEGQQELEDAEKQLDDAQKELDDAQKEIEDSENKLEQARVELWRAKKKLDAGYEELATAGEQLDEGKAELESGWNELENGKAQIRDGVRGALEEQVGDTSGSIAWARKMPANVDDPNATAMYFWITTTYYCDLNLTLEENIRAFVYSDNITDEMLKEAYVSAMGTEEGFDANMMRSLVAAAAVQQSAAYESDYAALQSGCRQWDEGHAKYIEGLNAYNEGAKEYQAGQDEYNKGLNDYQVGLALLEEGKAEYEEGKTRYEEAKANYEQGLADAEAGRKELEDGRKQLEEGETSYQDAMIAIADGENQLEEARGKLDDTTPCRWIVLNMKGNPGYVQLRMAGDNLKSLESTFALLFVLVGALVIFATVSKMVDEQRTQVGTTKALGFFNREIFRKYLSFGVSAALLGAVIGVLVARFAMEGIVLKGYNIYYTFSLMRPGITVLPTVIVLLAAAGLAVVAVWAACSRLLRTPAIRLLQAKVPTSAKKEKKGKGSALSLYSRLILLNMRTDIKRVLVTIVSVAGCCALVVIGMTLKAAMNGSLDRQYVDIEEYDWRVTFNPGKSETARDEIETLLNEAGTEYTPLSIANITYRFGDIQTAELFCGDAEEIGKLYHLRDWKTAEPVTNTDEGILIQLRVAEYYHLAPGSTFQIALGGVKTADVVVAGVFDHYIGRPMVISPSYYEQVFGEKSEINAFFVRLNGADADALDKALRDVEGFAGLATAESGRAVFDASTSVIDSLVMLFIFMAAVMAGVVLMNLTNIYVLQKKRELTIMRVNGFTVKEVVGYMLRETVITTALGIIIGMFVGSGIGRRICLSMEQPFLQVVKEPSAMAWITGAALTVLFTVLVNIIALRPVKNLKLTDVV
ncbi:MAG: FtsX-like permease family protein [Oscillospiraceae bacterium]|nr:FtsX-like permease family protein [Oscillospiraceae bacterium]